MIIAKDHKEVRAPALRQFVRENPLGLFTTSIHSINSKHPELQATHIPFLLDVQDEESSTELGKLRGHMDRANPQAKAFVEALKESPNSDNVLQQDVLVVFTSPVQQYITTRFYSQTMSGDKRTAPTWNYSTVQVYGKAKIFWDANSSEASEFLMTQLNDLARLGESDFMGYTGRDGTPAPWKLSDAPASYVQRTIRGIIGVEITIDRLEGKVKMSQELNPADREGVIQGLKAMPDETAQKMADLVRECGELKMANKAAAVKS